MSRLSANLIVTDPQDGSANAEYAPTIVATVTIRNLDAEDFIGFDPAEARYPSLALEIEDAAGDPVHMPPPPLTRDPTPGHAADQLLRLGPDEETRVRYVGFLDHRLPSGRYRVRFAGRGRALGADGTGPPLLSPWVEFTIRSRTHSGVLPPPAPRSADGSEETSLERPSWRDWLRRPCKWFRCNIIYKGRLLAYREQKISGAPLAHADRNGCYSWWVSVRARLYQWRCTARFNVRIAYILDETKLGADYSVEADLATWATLIKKKWNGVAKLCCACGCCKNGYIISVGVQFFPDGPGQQRDQVITIGRDSASMSYWGTNSLGENVHEFGHMLGACDEYYTVQCGTCSPSGTGQAYGASIYGGNVMHHAAGPAAAHHYDLLALLVGSELLESETEARAIAESCTPTP